MRLKNGGPRDVGPLPPRPVVTHPHETRLRPAGVPTSQHGYLGSGCPETRSSEGFGDLAKPIHHLDKGPATSLRMTSGARSLTAGSSMILRENYLEVQSGSTVELTEPISPLHPLDPSRAGLRNKEVDKEVDGQSGPTLQECPCGNFSEPSKIWNAGQDRLARERRSPSPTAPRHATPARSRAGSASEQVFLRQPRPEAQSM